MKNIIITGTSRGIGFELVKQFCAAGYSVLAISRNDKPISNLKLKNCTAIACDITFESDIAKVRKYLKKQDKQIDILINNSGLLVNKPFEKTSIEDFQRCYRVNVFGVAAMIQATLPYMKTGGHVVNVSSMGGIQGSLKFPGLSAYSSSKGAVITLTELLAEEYKESGLSFNVLALGAVQTEMLAEAFPDYKAPITAQEMAAYIQNFALTGNKLYNGKVLQVSNSTP